MGLHTNIPEGLDEVDVIIAGGGTAGCVVAARLADADPKLSILVIEGGPNNEIPTIDYPAGFLTHLAPDSKTTLFYLAKKNPNVADRTLFLPAGGVLGGGSSINMMMYSRAQRSDWDSWNTPGWSADEMIPYLKKLETYYGEDAKGLHGHDGPLHISRGTFSSTKIENEFIAVAESAGWPEVQDLSDLETVNAIWRAKRFISPDGKRQDAASGYLHPRLRDGQHPNLHVVVETQVSRVLFDENKRAIGVEVRPNPIFRPGDADQPLRSIKARKFVIASSGACGTPSLLERSGLGDPKVLERAGVPIVVDLPGVGNGYEDHHLLGYPYLSSLDPTDTLDEMLYGGKRPFEDWIKSGNKMLGWNAQDIQGKVRPTEEEVALLGPEFQKAWDGEFKNHPDKPLVVFSLVAGFPGDPSLTTGDPCLSFTAFSVYPFSRGHIHITGPKLGDSVDFETGFFADPGQLDVKKHIWMYKKQRELIRRMPSYRGEMVKSHPPFAADSGAACVELTEPLATDVPNLVYSEEDDAVLEQFLRENVSTTWHSLGTCKMLPRDQMGVVDGSLNVYGVQGLKIADLSIAPRNVAANTNNTALAVGEKAADIFIKELGLSAA